MTKRQKKNLKIKKPDFSIKFELKMIVRTKIFFFFPDFYIIINLISNKILILQSGMVINIIIYQISETFFLFLLSMEKKIPMSDKYR